MKVVARIAGVPRSTRRLVAAWLIVEVAIWASAWAIGRAGLSFPQSPVDVLSNWDGTQYSAIARNGYLTEGAEVRRFALFPLLPLRRYLDRCLRRAKTHKAERSIVESVASPHVPKNRKKGQLNQ